MKTKWNENKETKCSVLCVFSAIFLCSCEMARSSILLISAENFDIETRISFGSRFANYFSSMLIDINIVFLLIIAGELPKNYRRIAK